MTYRESKVYYDGSHYIAIPQIPKLNMKEKHIMHEEKVLQAELSDTKTLPIISESDFEQNTSTESESNTATIDTQIKTKKEHFEELYKESLNLPKNQRRNYVYDNIKSRFSDERKALKYVDDNFSRKSRNLICRRIRMIRKANLHIFNYFCTFTYDDKKHNEETFKKKLKSTLSSFVNRKNWKYIGVWERAPKTNRLHFHGIFNIPDNTLPGTLLAYKDYNLNSQSMQITYQSLYFNERFGRSDFKSIEDHVHLRESINYLLKYIEKTNEKIVYSKGLSQYFITDIIDSDVICNVGIGDKKLLLYDDFSCWDKGEYLGQVSPRIIDFLRKSN